MKRSFFLSVLALILSACQNFDDIAIGTTVLVTNEVFTSDLITDVDVLLEPGMTAEVSMTNREVYQAFDNLTDTIAAMITTIDGDTLAITALIRGNWFRSWEASNAHHNLHRDLEERIRARLEEN